MWDVYVIMSLCVGCIVPLVTLSDVYVGCVRYYVTVCVGCIVSLVTLSDVYVPRVSCYVGVCVFKGCSVLVTCVLCLSLCDVWFCA